MDVNYLKKIVKVFDDSTADKLEFETDGIKFKIARNINKGRNFSAEPIIRHEAVNFQTPGQTPTPTESAVEETASDLYEIKSPIVGTFYRAPSPDSDSFVEVGSKVKVGDTLCIVEAMKLMNEIESDVTGTIEKILVENADAVEYNQPIFLVKPD